MWWSECLILDLTLDFSTNEAGPLKHFSATNGINPTTTTTYSPTISDEFTNIHSFDQSTVTSKSPLLHDLPSLKNEPSTSHLSNEITTPHVFWTFRITKLLCWHISARNRRKLLPLLFNPQPSRTALPAQHFPLQAPLFCTIITFQWPQMTRLPFWQTLFLIWRTWRQQQWSRESLQTV